MGIRHYSPPCKGGVDARSRKCREATLVRADGVARSASPIGRSLKRRSAKSLGLKSFAELTTPSAAFRRLRAFLLMPQPPLLCKEGNVSALKQSANSFTRSDALGWYVDHNGLHGPHPAAGMTERGLKPATTYWPKCLSLNVVAGFSPRSTAACVKISVLVHSLATCTN